MLVSRQAIASSIFLSFFIENSSASLAIKNPSPSVVPNRTSIQITSNLIHLLKTRTPPLSSVLSPQRNLASSDECTPQFLLCMLTPTCDQCFSSLYTAAIDWTDVTRETSCEDVLHFLNERDICTEVVKANAQDMFCNTFNSCVVFEDGGDEEGQDCSPLTDCNWEGIHESFLGDGICHDRGCYNTEVCGWDGGDCCEDTCKAEGSYVECGDDPYHCRDPASDFCEPNLNEACKKKKKDEENVICKKDEVIVKLEQYDSWGDGWGADVLLNIESRSGAKFEASLDNGFESVHNVCLKKGCNKVEINDATWGNEISWVIRPPGQGGAPLAYGGAPMTCSFPLDEAEGCENTCQGADHSAASDGNANYAILSSCIEKKCPIQLGVCSADSTCSHCLFEETPSYCVINDDYNSLLNCALCYCVDKNTAFCEKKSAAGQPADTDKGNTCNPAETLKGSSAILEYTKCSNIPSLQAMMSEWDENHFGALDTFEACAHTFNNDLDHGGKSALDCMRILATTAETPSPVLAVQEMATALYHHSQDFCDCTSRTNKYCPTCDTYTNFKTLLHESLDACKALDEIDCAAWSEFYPHCKNNMMAQYNNQVDFTHPEQCQFMQQGCGGAGAFPAFRHLDCGKEISKSAWDFYTLYQRSCLSDVQPTPANGADSNPSSAAYNSAKQKHGHVMWIVFPLCAVAAGVFFVYKRRAQSFELVPQMDRLRNYAGGISLSGPSASTVRIDGDLSGSTSFIPPNSLPPPPSATSQFV